MRLKNSSNKPYLIRSIYDWCVDSNFTPYISVIAFPELDIPEKYLKNDEIIFNISHKTVNSLNIDNDFLCFIARFNGIQKELEIPMKAIKGIFAKEVNQGILFSLETQNEELSLTLEDESIPATTYTQSRKAYKKPHLRVVK